MKVSLFSEWFVDKAIHWTATSMCICGFNGLFLVIFMNNITKSLFTEFLFNTLLLSNLCVMMMFLVFFVFFAVYGIKKYV